MNLPNKENVIITHYGCSDFGKEIHTVFWIGAVFYNNGKKRYFYVYGNEQDNIKEYFEFLKNNPEKKVLHWSMNSPKFGFIALSCRYKELTSHSVNLDFIDDIDLSEYLKEKYGRNYVDTNGRLNNLAILNGFSGFSDKIEIKSKKDATDRLELLFSIYQADQQDCLKINLSETSPHILDPIFATHAIDPFFNIIKNHFASNQQLPLLELLKSGKTPKHKLYFLNNGNMLLDAFKKLIESNLITNCNKAELEKWISINFKFRNRVTKESQDYKLKTINDTISNRNSKQPCKNPLLSIVNGVIIKE